ncbi:hypothetical protein EG329_007963 [Mollisiaceae sp. DMI_Dod_QoI]|nr:hypothetical protein EG329_007963 [Helotiales sp. DMI_Dod_QoI]
MANLKMLFQFFALFSASANAHFVLNYPDSLGFNQNTEDSSPCGGATLSFSNTTAFHVSGDAIALTTLHPQSDFLYRATTDQTAAGNWTVLSLIAEYGLGAFCEPGLSVPVSWVGQTGLLQIVQNAEDGIHYQVGCLLVQEW